MDPETPMEEKSEKDLGLLDALPTLPRGAGAADPHADETPLRPVDTGFGAWSFVSTMGSS
jgi:hypothetical protein